MSLASASFTYFMDKRFPGAQSTDFPQTTNKRFLLLDASAIIATAFLAIFIWNLSPL